MSKKKPNRILNRAVAAGAASDPSATPTPTITHYKQLADQFSKDLDAIISIIPKLESSHVSTARFVRSHQNVPPEFLASSVAAVEQHSELQDVKKLDITAARDTLQFSEAFRPIVNKVAEFAKTVDFTIASRMASLTADSLQIYSIAKGLARDPGSAHIAATVAILKRDLGRRGPAKGARGKAAHGKAAAAPAKEGAGKNP